MPSYLSDIRQLAIAELGHDDPVLLLTNQFDARPADLVDRYARRMVVENRIAEAIDFFHMDALSAAVPMRIDTDLQLTLISSTLYRLLANHVGNGHQICRARTLFRDFVDATASVTISGRLIRVLFGRRAHNPLMIHVGFGDVETTVPWLEDRDLKLEFG